jgi:hypothetical protein
MNLKIKISKFTKLKEEIKKFRGRIFGKKDKLDICKKYDITTDEITLAIKYIAYESKKEKDNLVKND